MTPALQVAEPPATYRMNAPLVVDCSLIAGWVFRETWAMSAEQQMQGCGLHAPHLLQVELASVALKKQRRGETHAAYGMARAEELSIELHRIDPVGVLELALAYQLTAYDASYLWLAAELRCPLATFDQALGAAAKKHLDSLG
jgi:predicted nucleic acid-binding protein